MKLLPIGSIIELKGHKMCIVGYTSVTKDGQTQCGYYAVPYPVGFVNARATLFVPTDAVTRVLQEGYQTQGSQKLLGLLGTYFQASDVLGPEQILAVAQAYKKAVDRVGEGAQP